MELLEATKKVREAYPWVTVVVEPEGSSGFTWKLTAGHAEYVLDERKKKKQKEMDRNKGE